MFVKKVFLGTVILLFFTYSSFGQFNKDFEIIKNLMNEQQTAWNKGNIVSYMQYYWQSDSMMFVSKNGITFGWEQTLKNYQKTYPDQKTMGKLIFDQLKFQKINNKHIIAIGRWQLKREKGDIGGYFSLIWEKQKGKWKIIIDHTS